MCLKSVVLCSVLCEPFSFVALAGCTDTVLLSVATYAAIIFVPYSFGICLLVESLCQFDCVCVCARARIRVRDPLRL